jgi:hypothetical protein
VHVKWRFAWPSEARRYVGAFYQSADSRSPVLSALRVRSHDLALRPMLACRGQVEDGMGRYMLGAGGHGVALALDVEAERGLSVSA